MKAVTKADEWTRDPTSDAWRAKIELLPQEELLYGAQEVQLSFSSDACTAEVRPPDKNGSIPADRLSRR